MVIQVLGIDHAYRLLSECNQVLLLAQNENQLLQEICRVAVDIGYRFAWVGYLQNDELQTIIPVAQAGYGEGYVQNLRIQLSDPERGLGPTGMAIRTGQPHIARNIAIDPNYIPWRIDAVQRSYASSIAIPLMIDGAALGALNIYAYEIDAFDNDELAFTLLTKLADNLSYGIVSLHARIEQGRIQEALENSVQMFRKTLNGAVKALSAVAEKRDPYTADHQQRVSEFARAIATEMGFNQQDIRSIVIAGLLHDIGKISIPFEILNKPGLLTDIEMALVKVHPQNGFDIVQLIPFEEPIAEIVLQHHERIDGSGYPLGLTKNDILPQAKILAVADVVEAISSLRPYRQALGIDKALAEIIQNKGKLYDDEVVAACIKVLNNR